MSLLTQNVLASLKKKNFPALFSYQLLLLRNYLNVVKPVRNSTIILHDLDLSYISQEFITKKSRRQRISAFYEGKLTPPGCIVCNFLRKKCIKGTDSTL
jgi:hypothetical protein